MLSWTSRGERSHAFGASAGFFNCIYHCCHLLRPNVARSRARMMVGTLHSPLMYEAASSPSQTRPIVVDRWQPVGVASPSRARGALTLRAEIKSSPQGLGRSETYQPSMGTQTERSSSQQQAQPSRIWWSNATVFVSTHLAAAIGCYFYPFYMVPRSTLILCVVLFQFAEFSSVSRLLQCTAR